MRVIFICGSLEPGMDGVGDYTQRLAKQLIIMGNHVSLLAFNDKYINEEIKIVQEFDGNKIHILRLPAVWSVSEKYKFAKEFIEAFNPDWLCLQYVPFAYNSKGLTFGLGSILSKLGKGRKWHIMFHELWLGVQLGASKKEVMWGFIQRKLIISLISKLKPKLIHTQSVMHQSQLTKNGIDVCLLSLFSNIPIASKISNIFFSNDTSSKKNKEIVMVLFGSVHNTGAPISQFVKEVKKYAIKMNKQIRLVILGRVGNEIHEWKKLFLNIDLEVEVLGERSIEEISSVLQFASYGITTTVYDKVDKSGSVAAMLEHGLNVICVAGSWKSKLKFHLERHYGVIEYKPGELDIFFNLEKNPLKINQLEIISKRFIEALKAIK